MLNINIAEDDNDDFLSLIEAIENVLPKFNIQRSVDGKSFLNGLQHQPAPDLIFLDLNMPKMNGIECLTRLRQIEALNTTPTIIYSTSSDVEDIELCYKNGCTLYLVKPPSFKDLVTQIRKIFFRLGLPRQDLLSKEMFVVEKQVQKD